MSGPEYAAVFEQKLEELGIKIYSSSMVTSITKEREVTYQKSKRLFHNKGGSHTRHGCRERSRGAVAIPAAALREFTRRVSPKKLVNCEGYTLGKKFCARLWGYRSYYGRPS